MRSIRLSLTVYFLLLVTTALGAVSLLFLRHTRETLRDRQRSSEQLLRTRFEEDTDKEEQKLDRALFAQAQALAREVQFRTGREFMRYWPLNSLGVTVAVPSPMGSLSAVAWGMQDNWHSDINRELTRRLLYQNPSARIAFNPADLPTPIDESVQEYFQVNAAWDAVYHSPSLQGRTFAFDRRVFSPNRPVIDVHYESDRLDDVRVRRVVLLAPAARFLPFGTVPFPNPQPRTRRGGRGDDPPAAPAAPSPSQGGGIWTRPALCIQYACDTTKLDASLAELKAQLDTDLASIEARTVASQAELRNRLLLINGLAFVALVVGACLLIDFGLSPLKRVGEAVGKVTEKDFHLPLDRAKLPRELTPIVDHLSATLEQLKRAFAREKQATADISHELRTPLSALLTTIEVTLRKPRQSDEYREALQDCQTSAKQINHAVERLLALARLDAGVDRIRTQVVDAGSIARECISVIRPLAEANGLSVHLEAEDKTVLSTDPDKLREILSNLLHNAIHYNKPNGTIDVEVHRGNGHVRMEVRDTGIGISQGAKLHIFERFFRADPSRQSDGLHSGLGLAIVKGYLDLMGGSIDVDSVEGQGSSFRVLLPA